MSIKEKFLFINWDRFIYEKLFPVIAPFMMYNIYNLNMKHPNLRHISIGLLVLPIIISKIKYGTSFEIIFEEKIRNLALSLSFVFIGINVYQQNFSLYNIPLYLFAFYIVKTFITDIFEITSNSESLEK